MLEITLQDLFDLIFDEEPEIKKINKTFVKYVPVPHCFGFAFPASCVCVHVYKKAAVWMRHLLRSGSLLWFCFQGYVHVPVCPPRKIEMHTKTMMSLRLHS